MDILSFFSPKASSKSVAKDRLKLILIHDRANLSPELLQNIKEDFMKVISKYVEIDSQEMEVRMMKSEEVQGESPALIASIPIKRMKRKV